MNGLRNDWIIDQIAVRTLETWLLSKGFTLSGGFESKDHGPHRVWTVSAHTFQALDSDKKLMDELTAYLEVHNQLPSAVKFQPYDVGTYASLTRNGGTYIYASIYQ
jgi:hypothetical protein